MKPPLGQAEEFFPKFLDSTVYSHSCSHTLREVLEQQLFIAKINGKYPILSFSSALDSAVALLSAYFNQDEVALEPPSSSEELVSEAPPSTSGSVGIWTSGSTGHPKLRWQTVSGLVEYLDRVRTAKPDIEVWGFLYDPRRLAGLSVIATCMATNTRFVWSSPSVSLETRLMHLLEGGAEAIALTPSQARLALRSETFRSLPLKLISLGGENADQKLLDGLKEAHPHSRVTHIYATSEIGTVASASDGKEGYPRHQLDYKPGEFGPFVRDGELLFNRPDGTTHHTGDLFSLESGRYRFVGRRDRSFNVGGQVVIPEIIESKLRTLASWILEVSAMPVNNPFLGHVVKLRVRVSDGERLEDLTRELREMCRTHLPRHEQPALIEFVGNSMVSETGKVSHGWN